MNVRRVLFLLPLLFGAAALLALLLVPGAQVGGAVLIGPVPVATGTSPAAAAAALLLVLLLFVLSTAWVLRAGAREERRRRESLSPPAPEPPAGERPRLRGAGVVMVGPVPIAVGNDPRLLVVAMGLAAALVGLGVVALLMRGGG